jgi:hypothetical protein
VTATDPEDNDVILVDDAKPAGATFDGVEGASPQSCAFSWTPTAAGSYEAIFVAADGYDGAESTQRVAITVSEPGSGGGLETFANYANSGSSYVTNTFTGQDGSTWTVGKGRGDIQTQGRADHPEPSGRLHPFGHDRGRRGPLSFKYRKPFSDSTMGNQSTSSARTAPIPAP